VLLFGFGSTASVPGLDQLTYLSVQRIGEEASISGLDQLTCLSVQSRRGCSRFRYGSTDLSECAEYERVLPFPVWIN
jgi:hypothetical protein